MNTTSDPDQQLTSNDLSAGLTFNVKEENETSAEFMPNASEQDGGTAYLHLLSDIAKLHLLISNS